MSVFGGMSKGERNRIKIRVRTAMAAQAQVEGRFLGGRPPYGYLLVDADRTPTPHGQNSMPPLVRRIPSHSALGVNAKRDPRRTC
jgi:hypothetical protein